MAGGAGANGNPFKEMSGAIKEAAQMQADSADKAMQIAQEQFQKSLQFVTQQYNTARSDVAPYRDIGEAATDQMYSMLGLPRYKVSQAQIDKINSKIYDFDAPWRSPEHDIKSNERRHPEEVAFRDKFGPVGTIYDPSDYQAQVDPATGLQKGLYGDLGLHNLADKEVVTPDDQLALIQANPDYQFRLKQGREALENSAAARGMLNSGSFAKELTGFGQGMASSAFADQLQNLANMMTVGTNAASFSANQATQMGSQVAGMRKEVGDTLGSGEMAKANALAHGLIGSKRWDIHANAVPQGGGMGGMLGGLGGMLTKGIGGMMSGGMGLLGGL